MKVFKSEKTHLALLADYERLLGLWGVKYKKETIKNGFGETGIIRFGEPSMPKLLLFHGVGDNSAIMWIKNAAYLSTRFDCAAVDTIGGPGLSVPGEQYAKGFSQLEWLESIPAALGFDKYFAAGVSNGANMVASLAMNDPRLVKALCIEGAPVRSNTAALRTMLAAFPEALFPTEKNIRKLMIKFAHPREGFFEDNPDIANHMLLIMRTHNQIAMGRHHPCQYDSEKLRKVSAKLFFLFGEFSGGKSTELLECLKSDGLAYKVIGNAGHGLNMEQPDATNAEISGFLK